MRLQMRRYAAAVAAAVFLVVGTAGGAHAIGLPGVPQIVFDPTAVGKLATQISRQYQQIRIAEQTLNQIRAEGRRFSRLPLVSFAIRQRGYARLFSEGNLLGYNNPLLDRAFQTAFPQSRISERLGSLSANQRALVRQAAHALVLGAGQQGAQLREAEAVLAQARNYAAGATSEAQIAQSQATLSALGVEEQQQSRQLQIAENNQRAVMDAYQLSRDAQQDSANVVTAEDLADRQRRAAEYVGRFKEGQQNTRNVWRPESAIPGRPR